MWESVKRGGEEYKRKKEEIEGGAAVEDLLCDRARVWISMKGGELLHTPRTGAG